MTLSVKTPYQAGLTRPEKPSDPNGIAHGFSNDTKTDRVTAKLAWGNFVQDWKIARTVGDSSGPASFPDNGEITYTDE